MSKLTISFKNKIWLLKYTNLAKNNYYFITKTIKFVNHNNLNNFFDLYTSNLSIINQITNYQNKKYYIINLKKFYSYYFIAIFYYYNYYILKLNLI